MNRMLGKLPSRMDARTLKFKKYFKKMPWVPDTVNQSLKVSSWGVMENDQIGDCTIAGAGHMEMTWTSNAGALYTPPDSDIVTAYSAVSGYIPGQPSTDNGAFMIDVLNYWRKTGISGHKIHAYNQVNVASSIQVRAALYLFGGLYVGVQLPESAMNATESGQCWSDTTDTNIIGGHAFNIVALDPWTVSCITWGQVQMMTWAWLAKYCDEAYAIISNDWIESTGIAPPGFNMKQLNNDLLEL